LKLKGIHIKELKSVRQALDKILDTRRFRDVLKKEKALNPLRLKASEMAILAGLEAKNHIKKL